MTKTDAINNINNMNGEQRKAFNDICDVKLFKNSEKISDELVSATAEHVNNLDQEELDEVISPGLRTGVKLSERPC